MPASTIDDVPRPDATMQVNGIQHDHTHEKLDEKADKQRGQGGQPESQQKQKGQRFKSGQAQPQLESAALAFEHGKLGFAYEIGVAERLRELGIITARTPVSGTSASALVAVAIACDIDFDNMLQALEDAAQDLLDNGALGRFRTVLNDAVEKLLPEDAHLLMLSNKAQIFLGATRTTGPCPACWHPHVLPCDYDSREEVKQALLTVAHLPIGSDLHFLTKFRNKRYMDGGIRAPVVVLPSSAATHVIRIYALPAKFLNRLWPYRLLQHPPRPHEIDIAPDKFGPWKYTYRQSSKMSLHPQGKEMLDSLRERGRQDGQRWAHQAGLLHGHDNSGALPTPKRTVTPEWQHMLLQE